MENLNKTIKNKLNRLNASNETFKDIFEIMHDDNTHVFCEKTNGFKIEKTSYTQCKNECVKMGSFLNCKLNDYEKNTYVGLLMENSPNWIYIFWGLLMAGYKPLLLNKRLGDILNSKVVELTNLKVIITDTHTTLNVDEMLVSEFDLSNVEIINDFKWANEIALTTSATSLDVKVCAYDGMAIASQIKNTKDVVKKNPLLKKRYNGEIKMLAFLPFYHIFGLVASYFWYGFFNRTFVFLKDLSTGTILNTIKKHQVTHMFAVPLVWHTIYKEVTKQIKAKDEKTQKLFNRGYKLSLGLQRVFPRFGKRVASKLFKEIKEKTFGNSMQCMITGGSYISPKAMELLNVIGYPLFNGYGMSEIGITSVELKTNIKQRLRCSIGKPFKSVKYDISKDGTLLVKGRSISHKIISSKGVVQYKPDEWFDTTDLVLKDKKGNYFLTGRIDDVVISANGEKINPDVLEKQVFIPLAKRFSILGYDDGNGKKLTLIVEITNDSNKLLLKRTVEEVNAAVLELKKKNFNIEAIYYTYDPIASETAIKVSRKILLKYINDGKVSLHSINTLDDIINMTSVEIESEMVNNIINIIADILDIDRISIKSNSHFITDLGGGSLDYLCLLMKLKEEYTIDFDERLELYTPSSIALYISSK